MGSDLSVVNAARVSFHKESQLEEYWPWHQTQEEAPELSPEVRLSDKDQKLITYLAAHNHWSPFAHTSLQFRVSAPIFVARQLVKHQVGGVWNEVSRRYVDDEPLFYFPEVWRKRAENVKQGSSDEEVDPKEVWVDDACIYAVQCYQRMLDVGIAPEQARMVLPQNMMTEWIWTGSLLFFARVVKLRTDPHAQKETQEIAHKIAEQIPQEFEHSWKALLN